MPAQDGKAHQREGQHHRCPAAGAVAVQADDDAAERPRDEADTEGRQRIQQAMRRLLLRKNAWPISIAKNENVRKS